MELNFLILESENNKTGDELMYEKQMLSQDSSNSKILGFDWNKERENLLTVNPKVSHNRTTKMNVLNELDLLT